MKLLRIALDLGARPDAPSSEGRLVAHRGLVRQSEAGETPLLCAARRGHADALQLLLDRGASVHRRGTGQILTRRAAAAGARAAADDGGGFAMVRYDSMTALHVAVDGNHRQCAAILLDAGARVDARFQSGLDHSGYRALDLAALRGHAESLRLLLDRGARLWAFGGSFRRTALHYATIEGHLGCMRLLLERGAHREARDIHGWTPLGLAAFHGRVDAARLLVGAGAKVDARPSVNPSISKFQVLVPPASSLGWDCDSAAPLACPDVSPSRHSGRYGGTILLCATATCPRTTRACGPSSRSRPAGRRRTFTSSGCRWRRRAAGRARRAGSICTASRARASPPPSRSRRTSRGCSRRTGASREGGGARRRPARGV